MCYFLDTCITIRIDNIDQLLNLLDTQTIELELFPLKATMCAAKASRENSPIFVFTDDSTPDQELLGAVEAMVAEKNLEINIISDTSQISKHSRINRQTHKLKHSHYK